MANDAAAGGGPRNDNSRDADDAGRRLAEVEALAGIGSWEWDVAADRVRWSDQQFRIFDVEPQKFDATFRGYLDRLHPEDRHAAQANVERALSGGGGFSADYRVPYANGDERVVHCRGRAINDADGNVVRLIGTTQDITERHQLEADLVRRALHDPLTGLPNRTLMWDRLTQAVRRCARSRLHTVVFFVDVDGLKAINDGAGHHSGDRVLTKIGQRLDQATRQNDTVARYGGDEFVIVAEDVGVPKDAAALAERILDACTFDVEPASAGLHVSASVGGAIARPGVDPEEVVRDADAAMYVAKCRGGGTVELVGVA